jgi:hypothetical protein
MLFAFFLFRFFNVNKIFWEKATGRLPWTVHSRCNAAELLVQSILFGEARRCSEDY